MATDPMLTISELAELLGIKKHVIYRWRRQRVGPVGYRFGNSVRYRRSDVDDWLLDHRDRRVDWP